MRFCHPDGQLEFEEKGPPGTQPEGLRPWFEFVTVDASTRILFGHWSALGHVTASNLVALDSGCFWGNHLTAYAIGSGDTWQVDCPPA